MPDPDPPGGGAAVRAVAAVAVIAAVALALIWLQAPPAPDTPSLTEWWFRENAEDVGDPDGSDRDLVPSHAIVLGDSQVSVLIPEGWVYLLEETRLTIALDAWRFDVVLGGAR